MYETYIRVLCFAIDLYFMITTIKIMASKSNSTPVDATGRDNATACANKKYLRLVFYMKYVPILLDQPCPLSICSALKMMIKIRY